MKKKGFLVFLILLLVTALYAQGRTEQPVVREIFAMDTYMSVTCYGAEAQEAADAAVKEIQRLDNLLSTGKSDSAVSALNASSSAVLSSDMKSLTEASLDMYKKTSGVFDITIYPLMQLWGFTSGSYHVPQKDELEGVLKTVGSEMLSYDKEAGTLVLSEGQSVDFGGIAKGYTSDSLINLFSKFNITGAIVSLGGNVQVYGSKPNGDVWRCGIMNPFDAHGSNQIIGVLEAEDEAIITSGAYERFFTSEDGVIYHHIINPFTGYPAESDLASVTIVSEKGTEADALSTACFIIGLKDSVSLWKQLGRSYDMILITDDGTVYITPSLKNRFTTDYPLQIID